ncbi:MAG: hypothetical protein DRZ82_06690 [Thermoprotei archaeon]|nr:MAG: hypothetical protein DRZ82_06690 [Thermoprotei archaeon]
MIALNSHLSLRVCVLTYNKTLYVYPTTFIWMKVMDTREYINRYLKAAKLAAEWLKTFQVKDASSEYYGSIPAPYKPKSMKIPKTMFCWAAKWVIPGLLEDYHRRDDISSLKSAIMFVQHLMNRQVKEGRGRGAYLSCLYICSDVYSWTWYDIADTGVAASGMIYLYKELGDSDILESIKLAGEFILSWQDPDEGWIRAWPGDIMLYGRIQPYNVLEDSPWCQAQVLPHLYKVTKDKKWLNAAIKAAEFSINNVQQDKCGIFWRYDLVKRKPIGPSPSSTPQTRARTEHYVMELMLDLYEITGEDKWLNAAIKEANYCLKTQNSDGSWYHFINTREGGKEGTGSQMIALSLLRVYSYTKDKRYLKAALKALDWVASLQYTGCDALAFGGIVSYGGDVYGEISSWGTGAALLAFYKAVEILEQL